MLNKICTDAISLVGKLSNVLLGVREVIDVRRNDSGFALAERFSLVVAPAVLGRTIVARRGPDSEAAVCIRDNIRMAGLIDMQVMPRGVGMAADGSEVVTSDLLDKSVPLSALCAEFFTFRHKAAAHLAKADPSVSVNFDLRVYRGGKDIGYVNSDGRFAYTAAPDLRSVIAWSLVTDVDPRSLRRIDPAVLERIEKTACTVLKCAPLDSNKGSLEDYYALVWLPLVWMNTRNDTFLGRYPDARLSVARLWWTVGMQCLLGINHSGFEIA